MLSDNKNYQGFADGFIFYLKKAKEVGNIIMGKTPFEGMKLLPGGLDKCLPGIQIIVISAKTKEIEGCTVVR